MHSAASSCLVTMHVGKSAAFGIDQIALLLGNRFFALIIQSPCTSTLVSTILEQCPDRREVMGINRLCLLACRQGAELLKDVFRQNQVWCE